MKVHKSNMKEVSSVRYLGDIIAATGGARESIEDRRNKRWGNGMLFSTEALSNIKDAEMDRLKQLDLDLLRSIVDGHSKCNTEETQLHIFQCCKPIIDKLGLIEIPSFNLIYGTAKEQKCAIEVFTKIDDMRKQIQDNILPGGQMPGPGPARSHIP